MKKFLVVVKKVLFVFYLLVIHALAIFFVFEKFVKPGISPTEVETAQITDPTEKTPVPTPLPIPSFEPIPTVTPTIEANTNQNLNNVTTDSPNNLMIPVVGIKRSDLRDTFNDARSEGRVHNAIDIMAAGGTPVVAAADGEIAKFFDSERGGITIYQYSTDRKFAFYYAHLQRRADNLAEKAFVKRGTVIGYVGDTGNAGAGNNHLHFTISTLIEGQSYQQGTDVNPYTFLKDAIEAK